MGREVYLTLEEQLNPAGDDLGSAFVEGLNDPIEDGEAELDLTTTGIPDPQRC